MNRRSFLQAFAATASGLLLPEPRKVYSFARELRVPGVDTITVCGPRSSAALGMVRITVDGVDINNFRVCQGVYEIPFPALASDPTDYVFLEGDYGPPLIVTDVDQENGIFTVG